MQYVASRPGIALYYIDSELKAEWGDRLSQAGIAVIAFLDENLFNYGYTGKMLISAPGIDRYSYIQVAVLAANQSLNEDRYFLIFDREHGYYDDVLAILSRLTDKQVYSTGSSACSPITYDHALEVVVVGKRRGENGRTIDERSSIKDYINLSSQRDGLVDKVRSIDQQGRPI